MNLDYKYLTYTIIFAICITTLIAKFIQTKAKEKVKNLKLLDIVFEKELMKRLLEVCTLKHNENNFITEFLQIIEQYFGVEGLIIGTLNNNVISYLHPSPNFTQLELIKKLLKLVFQTNNSNELYSYKLANHEGRAVYLLKIKTAYLEQEFFINFVAKLTLSGDELKFLLKHISHITLLALNLHKQKSR